MVHEFELFSDVASDGKHPTVVCGSGSGYNVGCGCLVVNDSRNRQAHAEFHNKLEAAAQ